MMCMCTCIMCTRVCVYASLARSGDEDGYREGDTLSVPPGVVHKVSNPSPTETLVAAIKLTPPPPHAEATLQNFAGLARDNLANPLAACPLLEAFTRDHTHTHAHAMMIHCIVLD